MMPPASVGPDGWFEGVERIPSPNCDARPPGVEPELLVVHAISLPPSTFGGRFIDALFLNRLDPNEHPYFAGIAGLRVSAHVLVRRSGEVVQFVPLSLRAWHAGNSCFQGRPACNDFSIGIELEGDDFSPFEDVQYLRLAALARAVQQRWPVIDRSRLVGHCDVSPGRKTDPGPFFDWPRLHHLLPDASRPADQPR
jgi:N-acetyl-anhydromuramoyl-L-alanine amidase